MAHTLADVTAAANDPHLRDRLISAAAEAGIDSPDQWVDTRMRLLAAAAARGEPGRGHRRFPPVRTGGSPAVMPAMPVI